MSTTTPTEGGIIRVAHNRANPYTMINRAGAEDSALSWEARGVLFYLLCKPDGWQVRFTDLLRRGDAGRLKLRRLLHELEAAGYLVRVKTRAADGRYTWVSTVYEQPGCANRPMDERAVDERAVDSPPIKEVSTVTSTELSENPAPPAPAIQAPTAAEVQARGLGRSTPPGGW